MFYTLTILKIRYFRINNFWDTSQGKWFSSARMLRFHWKTKLSKLLTRISADRWWCPWIVGWKNLESLVSQRKCLSLIRMRRFHGKAMLFKLLARAWTDRWRASLDGWSKKFRKLKRTMLNWNRCNLTLHQYHPDSKCNTCVGQGFLRTQIKLATKIA